jgi:Fur family transcriptional regulator, zinc uptake regulator
MIPAAIRQYCHEQSCEMTPIRAVVLEHLWASAQPSKAYAMIDVLRSRGVGAPKPATVYRTLEYLSASGLVHKVHSLNAYVPCNHPGRHQGCQLLICQQCTTTRECCETGVARNLPSGEAFPGFQPTHAVVEVFGTCADCRDSKACS